MSEKKDNKRQHPRYPLDSKLYFDTPYEADAEIDFKLKKEETSSLVAHKYLAFMKNVSTEGLCFISQKDLKEGDEVNLDVHVSPDSVPVCMEGVIMWSRQVGDLREGKKLYEAGIKIKTLEQENVYETIHFDEKKGREWSIVLEKIFGS